MNFGIFTLFPADFAGCLCTDGVYWQKPADSGRQIHVLFTDHVGHLGSAAIA